MPDHVLMNEHVDGLAAAVAAAGGMTLADLSAWSETDPNGVKHADTVLGTLSDLVADAVHGTTDGGLDPCMFALNLGAPTSEQRLLHLRLECATPPTEDPGGGAAGVCLAVLPDETLASTEGYIGALMRSAAPTDMIGSCVRMGSNPATGGAALVGTPLHLDLFVQFEGTTAKQAWATGSGDTSGWRSSVQAAVSGGTFTNVWIAVLLIQLNGAPTSKVSWDNVSVYYEWV